MEEVKKQGMASLFCPYEQALALKQLGFNAECFAYYDKDIKSFELFKYFDYNTLECISAPLYRQAFSFFREKYKLYATLPRSVRSETFAYVIATESDGWFRQQDGFKTYEEAELECIKTLIEIVNKKS